MDIKKMMRTSLFESFLLKMRPTAPPAMPAATIRISMRRLNSGTDLVTRVEIRLADWDKKMTIREFFAASFMFME